MTCLARTATLLLVATICGSGAAAAQATAVQPADPPWYAELNAAATLGHRSASSFGGEGGYRVRDDVDVFVEGGHMRNVGSADLDARAQKVASAVGATANASYRVTFFDAGVRYHILPMPTVHPYLALGLGVAQVKAETGLGVNGVTVSPESLGVQFGSDLNGVEKRAYLMIGAGATWDFGTRYLLDVTYRYGRLFPYSSGNPPETEPAISTQRVQIGVGIHF
jgi:opacity protein-like surface antigen